MAARRLIAVLIMLLVVSSLAAALAPDRESSDETTESTTTSTVPEPNGTGASVINEVIPPDPGKPVLIEAGVGDQLQLQVEADSPTEVEIETLGLTGFAAAGAPARFVLLLRDPGVNPVTLADETIVARIRVGEDE